MAQELNSDRNDVVSGEIIPPDRTDSQPARGRSGIWISVGAPGGGFSYAAAPRPFVIILVLLALAVLLTVILVVLLGTLLIGISIFGALVALALLSGFIRRHLDAFADPIGKEAHPTTSSSSFPRDGKTIRDVGLAIAQAAMP